MILIVTPNPSLDKTAVVPDFALGRTFRVPRTLTLAGGKGFNVARALRTLGAAALVVGPLAGHTGRLVQSLAEAEGLACQGVAITGETRTCLTIIHPQTGEITELYEAGPQLEAGDWERIMAAVAGRLRMEDGGWRMEDGSAAILHPPSSILLLVCGSFPPGTPPDGLSELLDLARSAGTPALLDTYGPQLAQALNAEPELVKINQHEAAALLDIAVETTAAALTAAAALRQRGARSAVITLGMQGAAGIDSSGQRFGWAAPRVAGICAVGSGDALLGGLAAGLARGLTLSEAVRIGVAAGAANTLQLGAGVFERGQVERLVGEVRAIE